MNNNKSDRKNNVIPFPVRKPIQPQQLPPVEPAAVQEQRRRILASAFMGSLAVVVTLCNLAIQNQPETKSPSMDRAIASVETDFNQSGRIWAREVASEMSKPKTQDTQQAGRHPSSQDQLQFGTLNSNYRLLYLNGKVQQAEYSGSALEGSAKDPVFVDPNTLLTDNRQSLAVSYWDIRREESTPQQAIYTLVDHRGDSVGRATFRYDSINRLLSFRVDSL